MTLERTIGAGAASFWARSVEIILIPYYFNTVHKSYRQECGSVEERGWLETKSICQKFGDASRKSNPARVLPFSVPIDRATRQARSSFVCRFDMISSCEGFTFAESCINPPTALTFSVSVFSKNGSSASHPYTNTGVASATRELRRLSFRSGVRLSGRRRLDCRCMTTNGSNP